MINYLLNNISSQLVSPRATSSLMHGYSTIQIIHGQQFGNISSDKRALSRSIIHFM